MMSAMQQGAEVRHLLVDTRMQVLRKPALQIESSLLRRVGLGLVPAKSVGDPMYMGIDSNSRVDTLSLEIKKRHLGPNTVDGEEIGCETSRSVAAP